MFSSYMCVTRCTLLKIIVFPLFPPFAQIEPALDFDATVGLLTGPFFVACISGRAAHSRRLASPFGRCTPEGLFVSCMALHRPRPERDMPDHMDSFKWCESAAKVNKTAVHLFIVSFFFSLDSHVNILNALQPPQQAAQTFPLLDISMCV